LGLDHARCRSAFDGECKEVYVLKEGDALAGFVILQVCGSFRGYIQTLYVDEARRGQGLGTKLLEFCEQRILKISPNIFICVSSFNTSALKLYERFGFKLVGELKDFVKSGYSELLLRKTYGPLVGYQPVI
ncbi:MAG TPA: N-acetyltransferase, partial [Chitinophagaceae bacterium]|nr:N-acetyltransferase [Chitinophagaceae bacterium]